MSKSFKNRVFGCAIIKSINSNFNADFTHQPRTLPDGRVYATDKALKYSIRHYLKRNYPKESILYYKRLNEQMNPLSLDESYTKAGLGNYEDDHENKFLVLKNLLSAIDVRLFGSTFAAKSRSGQKVNLSVHGPVQLNHGINQFYQNGNPVNEIYSEQITSPFRSDDAKKEEEAAQTTIGRQSKLREGHYVYHFSINPQNLDALVNLVSEKEKGVTGLTKEDIKKLKEGLRLGVTYFDSSSKAGSDNELLLWVQLKDDAKLVLPSFSELVKVTRKEGALKSEIDLVEVTNLLDQIDQNQIEKVELFYLPEGVEVINPPKQANNFHLLTGKAL